ncbi:MAG: hypothetical protein WKF48_05765 [Solirubrobacteraceae bacterium]
MGDAARLQLNGLDGMRYLGADPSRPADHVEVLVMEKLNNRIVAEQKKLMRDA